MRGTHRGPPGPWRRRREPRRAVWGLPSLNWPPPPTGWLPATMPGAYTAELAAIDAAAPWPLPELAHEEEAPSPAATSWSQEQLLTAFRHQVAAMVTDAWAEVELLLHTHPAPEEA